MSFSGFHGRDPEPLQRPHLAGVIAGALAALPAAALVWSTGSAEMPGAAIGLSLSVLILLSIAGLAIAGGLYGAVFLRAGNDRRGGWLFGLCWGFLVWALGPITLSQWLLGRPVAIGVGAMILLAGHLMWGLLLGLLFPWAQARVERAPLDAPSPRRKGLKRVRAGSHPPRSAHLSRGGRDPAEDI